MRDGRTKRLSRPEEPAGIDDFLERNDVRLVVVSGNGTGVEFRLLSDRLIVGRGPGVDFTVDDQAMSRQHAAFEFGDGEFRIRDLGSMNGVRVNGRPVQVAELGHGDRIEIGSQVLQYVVEARDEEPVVYELECEE